MHIDEIDYSLPYTSRYKSGMIIPGGVNICNSTSDAEYYKVTSIINISCPEHIETAWIARELHDGGGFSIRWAVEPVTYENAYSIGDRVIDDTTKKTFEVIAYRRASFGDKYISSLNKTTILTGSTNTERWIVSEVRNYTIQTCNRIWDESIRGYAIVPEFEIRVYDRAAKNGDYGFCFTDSGSFVCDVDENYFSFPLWKYCEFVSGVNPLEEQKAPNPTPFYKIGDIVDINGLSYKIVDYRRATKGEQYLWLVDNNQPRVGFSVRDSAYKQLIVVPVKPEWKYETAFRLGDVVEDSTINVRYAGKYCISAYRIPQANEYYLSRCFTSEKATLVNHTGNKGFWENSQSYWILEKVFDYETEFKIGDVITDKEGDKYAVSAYRKAGIHELCISRFHSIPVLFKATGFTSTAYWIVEPVETNPYLECSPAELWSHIRMVDLGNRDDYRKVYEAFMKRCK